MKFMSVFIFRSFFSLPSGTHPRSLPRETSPSFTKRLSCKPSNSAPGGSGKSPAIKHGLKKYPMYRRCSKMFKWKPPCVCHILAHDITLSIAFHCQTDSTVSFEIHHNSTYPLVFFRVAMVSTHLVRWFTCAKPTYQKDPEGSPKKTNLGTPARRGRRPARCLGLVNSKTVAGSCFSSPTSLNGLNEWPSIL